VRLRVALSGRYAVERELGAGGMATVYLARDLRHDRQVAIKVLHPELAAALGAERFLSEIKTTARLQHPHILPLLDSGEADGLLYYVMPYVSGETLRARLTREQQLPIADAVRIAREVADGLGDAHVRGIIHRDIKPENILLQGEHALVADFGIALAVQQAGGQRMTQTGLSLGTPQYMAPEQAMGEKQIDARADIYALGVVLYEMLAGEPPFTGATVQAIVSKVITDAARPLATLRKSVPEHVAAAVLQALEKLPADRFATAAEFASALASDGFRWTGAVRQPVRGLPISARNGLMGLLAVTTALALLWGFRQGRQASPQAGSPTVRFTFQVNLGMMPSGNMVAVSPDGSSIVFLEDEPTLSRHHLSIRRLDDEKVVALPGTEGGQSPFFSPDGESVAFNNGSRLLRIDLKGGGVRTVADLGGTGEVGQGAWFEDGTILFVGSNSTLYRIDGPNGTAVALAKADSARYRGLSWLPDGKRVLVNREPSPGGQMEVVVISAESGKVLATLMPGLALGYLGTGDLVYMSPEGALMSVQLDPASLKPLTPPAAVLPPGTPPFAPLARTLPVAVSSGGALAFATADFADKEMVLVTPGGRTEVLPLGKRAFRSPRFSPDGRRIAVNVESGGDLMGDIWIYDRNPGTFSRLTFDGASVFPEWTPDGREVVYSTIGTEGSRDLFRMTADRSSPPERLVHGAGPIYEGAVSPREGTLFYRENSEVTGRDIYLRHPGGQPVPFAAGPAQERSAAISPDGRLVLYTSNESGTDEIVVGRADGGGRTQVSGGGGSEPHWTADGREALFWCADTLFTVPITVSPTLAVGTRRRVLAGRYVREPLRSNYDVTPDGKTFVMLRAGAVSTGANLTILLNRFDPARRATRQ